MDRSLNVGILLFTDVEVLDFAGPFEVFSVAGRVAVRDGDTPIAPFNVLTVGRTGEPVAARHGLMVSPAHALADCPPLDILIVPGGIVAEPLGHSDVLEWLTQRHVEAGLTASVCTGAFLLARIGLLEGRSATTHWEDIAELRAVHPGTRVVENVTLVDEGEVITSAGVASGIAMSLTIVADLFGPDLAIRTARQMEYPFTFIPRDARAGRGTPGPKDWRKRTRTDIVATGNEPG